MPASNKPPRKAVSFRLRTELVARMRRHIRDYSGKNMYLSLAPFLESAIEREIERTTLIATGALPADQLTGTVESLVDPVGSRRTAINSHQPCQTKI